MNALLLNSYWALDKVGYLVSAALTIIFVLVWIFVMFRYLDTSDLNE